MFDALKINNTQLSKPNKTSSILKYTFVHISYIRHQTEYIQNGMLIHKVDSVCKEHLQRS